MPRSGIEPTTCWTRVQRLNHCATEGVCQQVLVSTHLQELSLDLFVYSFSLSYCVGRLWHYISSNYITLPLLSCLYLYNDSVTTVLDCNYCVKIPTLLPGNSKRPSSAGPASKAGKTETLHKTHSAAIDKSTVITDSHLSAQRGWLMEGDKIWGECIL